jgi:hypothetical protein
MWVLACCILNKDALNQSGAVIGCKTRRRAFPTVVKLRHRGKLHWDRVRGTVDIKIRPTKLAFLVDPNSASQVREAIRLASSPLPSS